MPTRALWFSIKRDDPFQAEQVFDEADKHCKKSGLPFSLLINMALRAYLKMPKLNLKRIWAEKQRQKGLQAERQRTAQKQYRERKKTKARRKGQV